MKECSPPARARLACHCPGWNGIASEPAFSSWVFRGHHDERRRAQFGVGPHLAQQVVAGQRRRPWIMQVMPDSAGFLACALPKISWREANGKHGDAHRPLSLSHQRSASGDAPAAAPGAARGGLRSTQQLRQLGDVGAIRRASSRVSRLTAVGGVRPRLMLYIIGAVSPRDGCHTSEGSPL